MTTLAHLSDLHFGREHPDVVAGLLASLAEQQPETVIISGDLTQRAKQREYAAAKNFLAKLEPDCLIIPGNHDISAFNLAERFLSPWRKWQKTFGGTLDPVLSKSAALLLGINTTRRWGSLFDWSRGQISREQIRQVQRRLEAEPVNNLRLLIAHHPFWLPVDQRHRGLIGNRDAALAAFGNGQLDMILSGHVHLPYQHIQNGIIISHAGSSTSNRLLPGHSNSYKIFRGNRNYLAISLFIWDGEMFSCRRVDKFVRRINGWICTATENSEPARKLPT